jgi:Domain of Unknown Function (DUF928)
MPDSKLTEDQLSQLLASTLAAEGPDPQLMLRYAQAPDSLSEDETQQVKQYLTSSPAAADEFRVLQTFIEKSEPEKSVEKIKTETTFLQNVLSHLQTWYSELSTPQWAPAALVVVFIIPILLQLGNQDKLEFITPQYAAPNTSSPYWLDNSVRSSGSLELRVMAPDHIALTSLSQPDLYWKINKLPESGEFRLNITDAIKDISLLEKTVMPTAPGIQQLSLKKLNIELLPDTSYRWSITYSDTNEDTYSMGAIQFIAAPNTLQKALIKADEGEVSAIFARSGYWYDTFSKVNQLHTKYPDNSKIDKIWNSLQRTNRQ